MKKTAVLEAAGGVGEVRLLKAAFRVKFFWSEAGKSRMTGWTGPCRPSTAVGPSKGWQRDGEYKKLKIQEKHTRIGGTVSGACKVNNACCMEIKF